MCQGHEFDLLNLAVRPDGSRLVSVDVAGVVKEWNLAGPTPGLKTPFSSGVGSSVLLTPDETRVIFVPTNDEFDSTNENRPSAGFLRVTDGKGKKPVEIGPQLPGGHLHLLTLSADSRNLACLWDSGRDYTFLVVDMVEGRERLRKVFRPGSWSQVGVRPRCVPQCCSPTGSILRQTPRSTVSCASTTRLQGGNCGPGKIRRPAPASAAGATAPTAAGW